MVKGTQRKVIILKDTKSSIYDEAYFVVKKGADPKLTKRDMTNEALRIAEDFSVNKKKKSDKYIRPLWFFIGVAASGALCAALLAFIDINNISLMLF